jgi:hypothetical protein
MVLPAQGFGQKARGRRWIAFGREKEVDRRTGRVHGVAFHPDVVSSTRQESFVALSPLRRRRSADLTPGRTVGPSESEKRRYHPPAMRMTSGSNWRHLNRPQTEKGRRRIRAAYHGVTAKLRHFRTGRQMHRWEANP